MDVNRTSAAPAPALAALRDLGTWNRERQPSAPKRETNRELLQRALHGASVQERSDAAEALRRQIRTLCAAVVDRHTRARTAQEVEDLTQDVLVRLLQSSSSETADPTPAYLARIAVNLLIDQKRFLQRRGQDKPQASVEELHEGEMPVDHGASVEETVVEQIRRRELRDSLGRSLGPTEARVLWLRADGASHAEIAEELGIQPANARKHCERGLKRLRKLVASGQFALAP